MTENPYLSGVHAPVVDELEAHDLPVLGELPRELTGLFARNSANPRFPPPGRYHWFDGDGMVHAVHFEDGRATYRNRWIETRGLALEREAGRPLWGGILDPVDLQNPHGPFKDTANTDLVFHRGLLLATWWLCGTPYALEVPSLKTQGPELFGRERIPGKVAAHPKVDPRTGELVFFSYSFTQRPYMHFGVVSPDARLVHHEPIELPAPHINHDVAITENFVVLMDFPLGWDPAALAKGKTRIAFDRGAPARFGVVPRRGTNAEVRWFEAESCYMYHTISAYEVGPEVVVTGCRIRDLIPDRPDTSGRRTKLDIIELHPFLHRWRFNLETGAVKEEQLDDVPTEFPRANDRYLTRAMRYAYAPRFAPRETLMFDGLLKYDLERGGSVALDYGAGWFGGEAVFAPRPGASAEDDGWVVTCVTNAEEGRSECWVIDARSFEAGPVARVRLPRPIPLGFHAEWAPLHP